MRDTDQPSGAFAIPAVPKSTNDSHDQNEPTRPSTSSGIITNSDEAFQVQDEQTQPALNYTIFQVPNHICRRREELFRPQIVSIGPYALADDRQQVKQELQAMEVVKKQFRDDLVKQKSGRFLTACREELKKHEFKIRQCYYQSFGKINKERFIEIMMLDGIFIIQYFMKWKSGHIYSTIGTSQWNFGMILHDLLLLENQIPFFVLQTLFNHFLSNKPKNSNFELLTEIIGGFEKQDEDMGGFGKQNEIIEEVSTLMEKNEIKHLLHLYHHCNISKKVPKSIKKNEDVPNPKDVLQKSNNQVSRATNHPVGSILSASKLQEAGIKFKLKNRSTCFLNVCYRSKEENESSCFLDVCIKSKEESESTYFLDVTFENGVLEIPFISISDRMTYKFANLIALEQSTHDVGNVLTSYAVFMDKIIDTPDDVEILRHEGILNNMLGSNKEVAGFFNQLASYAYLDFGTHYLVPVFRDVDAYCGTKWHVQRAWLVRNYFSNPWVFISLLAAVVILILTFLQTYFSMYAYFRPPSTS